MRKIPVDQHHVDEVINAVEAITTEPEKGVIERSSAQQAQQLYTAIQKLQHWIAAH